jgi:hypothetical protein
MSDKLNSPVDLSKITARGLSCIEGGEFHRREQVRSLNDLSLDNFLHIGRILKACAQNEEMIEPLLDRLVVHADVVIGPLPPGIQRHGLVSDSTDPQNTRNLVSALKAIPEEDLRQWIIDDCSLVYGELSSDELKAYFRAVNELGGNRSSFVDLGSGLGKVVMTAALSTSFDSYMGVELVPYRHRLAQEQYTKFCETISSEVEKLEGEISENGENDDAGYKALESIRAIPAKISLEQGDMFDFNVSGASLIFIYSTCFGSFMDRVAQKVVNEAPPGCLVSTTTFRLNHPGLKLIKHYRAAELAWTDVRFYERVGVGPWEEQMRSAAPSPAADDWKDKAREILATGSKIITNKENHMATITIDDKEYDVDSLSDESKAQLGSLRYVDSELARLQAQAAALQTARIAYGRALKQTLEDGEATEEEEVTIEGLGETIQFDD